MYFLKSKLFKRSRRVLILPVNTGGSIIFLQEVPRWTSGRVLYGEQHIVHSSWSKRDETANRDGFDCGFLIPESLNHSIRDVQFGRYWSGVILSLGPFGTQWGLVGA